ncbi:MAG: Bax inhibitor-1/YccA family protein [Phycisphaerales bacterium]|nr:MAG: Bax inhibitor-1/YccA family protein [Phycisphaerales bacterium]
MDTYQDIRVLTVAQAQPDVRAAFIRRTYVHLAGAVAAFIGVEALLLKSPLAPAMLKFISANRYGWLMILGAFILAGWLGRSLASGVRSVGAQYAGLAGYVVAEAIIFVPLIYIAVLYSSPSVIPNAAILTALLFAGLTTVAFTTRTDFSFLQGILTIGGFVALGLIVCGAIFGFGLGLVFSVAMVGLASAAILYDTSKVIHHFSPDQHVAASLELFASVALLFWYVLRILMSLSRR